MEVGAFFLLVIVIGGLIVVGGIVYAIAMWLRAGKLDREGDTVESVEHPRARPERPERPEHVEAESEQRSRFIGTR